MSPEGKSKGTASEKCRSQDDANILESRHAHNLSCLREDATDPGVSTLEQLALVQDREARIREIRKALADLQKNL